ncbi:uracil-DNA glycosylase [Planctomycetota bacterium]
MPNYGSNYRRLVIAASAFRVRFGEWPTSAAFSPEVLWDLTHRVSSNDFLLIARHLQAAVSLSEEVLSVSGGENTLRYLDLTEGELERVVHDTSWWFGIQADPGDWDVSASPPGAHAPYSLKSEEERLRRKRLLETAPHMKPLVEYVRWIRTETGLGDKVPDFDPLDGGDNARVLILMEAPGPRAVESGFVSRNNPDPTARNLCDLFASEDIPREYTAIWNVVPWYLGTETRIRAPETHDLAEARRWLVELLSLLPCLQVVVLTGKSAQRAHVWLSARTEANILALHHTSARVYARWPELEDENKAVVKALGAWLAD